MISIILKLITYLNYLLQKMITILDPFIKYLNPSLFQNVLLGILTIFIPLGIVFFTNIKSHKKKDFEKKVFISEVICYKKIFYYSIIGFIYFSFYSGINISPKIKLLSFIILIILIFLFIKIFRNLLEYSKGYCLKFELRFLRRLRFYGILKYNNKKNEEEIINAWKSFWLIKSDYNEKQFLDIFINHIDKSIRIKKFNITIQLAHNYLKNIKERNPRLLSNRVLPKILKWNEILFNEEQLWQKKLDKINKKQNYHFQNKIIKIKNKFLINNNNQIQDWEFYINWDYFAQEFLRILLEILLKKELDSIQLFSVFKMHIDDNMIKFNNLIDENEKNHRWNYITNLFSYFCPVFFNEIYNIPNNYQIWKFEFPKEWKISLDNIDNLCSKIILNEFIKWARNRMFKFNNEQSDKDLTEVINGIFPNVDSKYFSSFLMLFFSDDLKDALKMEKNFYIFNQIEAIHENDYDIDKKTKELFLKKNIFSKEETIKIIFKYFFSRNLYGDLMKIYKDDFSKDDLDNWDEYPEKRILISNKLQKNKFKKFKEELESQTIINFCKKLKNMEINRNNFIELFSLLICEIEKKCNNY